MPQNKNLYLMPEEVSIIKILYSQGLNYRQIAEQVKQDITLSQFNKALRNLKRQGYITINKIHYHNITEKGDKYIKGMNHGQ